MRFLISILLTANFALTTHAQNLWQQVRDVRINGRSTPDIHPQKFTSYKLNLTGLETLLAKAPEEFTGLRGGQDLVVSLPMPDGSYLSFNIFRTKAMEDGLAAKYPGLKSFKGFQADDPSVTARIDLGPFGLHAAIAHEDGLIYIDPFARPDTEHYISYYTEDHISDLYQNVQLCGFDDSEVHVMDRPRFGMRSGATEKRMLRVYRLAMACTGEWGSRRGTVEKALADMVAMVNRANLIYEKELSIRMILIDNNDRVVYMDPDTDPYSNADQGRTILGQNTAVLNTRLGSANYDIGHLLSVCFDVGGVANYGAMCSTIKGNGVTCHNNNNIEAIVVRVVSHEMGHQMTASHTFNRCGQTDQLALGTAYEPGSGSTIMSYAGSCGSDNVTSNNDDYYHVASLEQMLNFTNSPTQNAFNCAQKIDHNNFVPEITLNYTNGFTIPKDTPFELTGSAFDANGDNLTYVWEQFDNGASAPLGQPEGDSPLFRSIRPTANPTRFFPNANSLLLNTRSNSEILPEYTRNMTFRFVVRDNNPNGGAVAWEELKFKVSGDAGPFQMIYPLEAENFTIGEKVTVRWDVANTDAAPINCRKVNIYFSIDGELRNGQSKLILVAKETPNDGEETIIVPNVVSTRVRIVVKAADNIFFTLSRVNSRIQAPTQPAFFMDVDNGVQSSCLPDNVSYSFKTVGFGGLNEDIRFEVLDGLPEGAVATFTPETVKPGQNVRMDVDLSDVKGSAEYYISVRSVVDGVDTLDRVIALNVTGTDLDYIQTLLPAGESRDVGFTQLYTWDGRTDARGYILQVATSPDFKPENIVIASDQTETTYQSTTFLEKTRLYYWRVKAYNSCRDGEWSDVQVFSTEAFDCFGADSGPLSINISASGRPTIEATLNVFEEGVINSVIVKKLRGDHQWVGDLAVFLTSPSGTEVNLWTQRCGSSKGFNLTLDDSSPIPLGCPLNGGRIFRPENPLAAFKGESVKGPWKIRIEDRVPGNGGRLLEYNLEFCSKINVVNPQMIKNDLLTVPAKSSTKIASDKLEARMDGTATAGLRYILVSTVGKGVLLLNNEVLRAGAGFTQADINSGLLSYLHTGVGSETDRFTFVVVNNEAGWTGIHTFNIEVGESEVSSVSDTKYLDQLWQLYPNPSTGLLNVTSLHDNQGTFTLQISDVNGRILLNRAFRDKNITLDASGWVEGLYFVKIAEGNQQVVKKWIKH